VRSESSESDSCESWPIAERSTPHRLDFATQVSNANHTFNGVVFEVRAKSQVAVTRVESFWVGGDLGEITIWANPNYRAKQKQDQGPTAKDWTNVAAGIYEPNWTDAAEVKLTQTVDISPGGTMGFYIHSALNNDQGIAYHSHQGLVCEDKNASVWSGWGHTSSEPFASEHGWSWRRNRGPSGAMRYSQVYILWSPRTHRKFPSSFKNVVFCLLAIHSKRPQSLLSLLPLEMLYAVLEYCHLQWFEDEEALARKLAAQEEEERSAPQTSHYSSSVGIAGWYYSRWDV